MVQAKAIDPIRMQTMPHQTMVRSANCILGLVFLAMVLLPGAPAGAQETRPGNNSSTIGGARSCYELASAEPAISAFSYDHPREARATATKPRFTCFLGCNQSHVVRRRGSLPRSRLRFHAQHAGTGKGRDPAA